jgi:hypothetical protein
LKIMRTLICSAAVLAVLAAGPALADTKGDGKGKPDRSACFHVASINGWTSVDDRTVDVTITPKNVWRLTLFAPSPSIDWTLRIGIDTRGQSWLCPGRVSGAEIIVPGDIGMRRYPITDIRKLTPEELPAPKKKS